MVVWVGYIRVSSLLPPAFETGDREESARGMGFYTVALSDSRELGHEGSVLGAEYLYIHVLEGTLIPNFLTIGRRPIVCSQPKIPHFLR